MVEIHKPPNEKIIDAVFVGLSEDPDGKNGIVAAYAPGIGGTPMVTASDAVLEFFKSQALMLAKGMEAHIKIYRFNRAECIFDTEKPK
jgi:hypothetical protein